MDKETAMKRLALWALIARNSYGGRRFQRAMDHAITLENATGLSVISPEMVDFHEWADMTFGHKAQMRGWWGLA